MMLKTMLLSILKTTTRRSNEVLLMFALLCVLWQFGNCFVSGESVANTGTAGVQAATATTTTTYNGAIKQQQKQQQTANATAAAVTSNTATTTQKFIQQRKENGESVGVSVGVGVDNAARNSGEPTLSEDGVERPTTYRPGSSRAPTNASQTAAAVAAQDRERKLKHVLAARRTALHRGGFRTRIGTTGRTATIETTSKSPTDPRSVCIRNCTKNFTRRTTASCMRQCANFSRMTGGNATVIVRPSSKSGSETAATERDTNEILFSDESSHGLFVVAKDQNDTLNHIPDAAKGAVTAAAGSGVGSKLRTRGRPAVPRESVTAATTSIEDVLDDDVNDDNDGDDALQPYLFFGQKLPPIKPATLTITSVSDEHPRLLEVSVAQTASTTPAPKMTATTRRALTAVERSRSRYKYNMRLTTQSTTAAAAVVTASIQVPVQRQRYVGSGRPTTGLLDSSTGVQSNTSSTVAPVTARTRVASAEPIVMAMRVAHLEAKSNDVPTSTPLIINVPSEEDEVTQAPTPVTKRQSTMATTKAPPTTTTAKSSTSTSTTTTAKPTTTTAEPSTTTSTTTTTTTTAPTTTTTPRTTTSTTSSTTTTTTTTSTSTTTTTFTPSSMTTTTAKVKSIIEEDTDRLRSMGPALTQHINIEDQNNLVVFCKNPEDCGVSPGTPISGSTDSSGSEILRTRVESSVRSTVHPPTSSLKPPASSYIGVVESAESQHVHHHSTPPTATQPEISSTVVTDDGEVSDEIRRVNIVNMVLSAVGLVPLVAIVLYLVRNYLLRRRVKDDEDFDVCITDQQPISPVTKLDSKLARDDDEDEVDHPMTQHSHPHHHHQQQQQGKMPTRDANHNHRYDDKSSLASEYQEFNRSKIRLKSLLGEGNFGQVWKAEADDLSGHFGATRIVAVKTIRACSAQASLKDEGNIMRKLGSHPNVVTLLGACVESEPHMLIMEYAMRGRLLSLLRAARSATNILPASVPGGRSLAPLSPRTLAGFALDIACGMEYIAERRIVHRDLAARNILLDHNGMCKICDFGMSLDLDAERKRKEQEKNAANEVHSHRFKFDFGGRYILQHWQNSFGHHNGHCTGKEHSEKKSHGHGHGHDTMGKRHALPIRWMAPEALQYHMFTTETDIWAFGIVLWEIATLGSTPYSHLTGREVIRRVPAGLRPELPKESRHEFYNLMSRCWHKDPHMRPSFSHSRLEITRSLHKWVDDDSAASDYMDVSGFSEDLEHGVVYFNHRISEFECEI